MFEEMILNIDEIVEGVENSTGYIFDESEVREVYAYTVRKCEVNRKGPDYIPILFENELRDYLMRAYINMRGRENARRKKQCASIATVSLI